MEKKYEGLFQPLTLPNKVTLKNRFVLAPMTHVSSHNDGTISDVELEYIEKRSKDVGLSISAASHVTPVGQAFTGQPSVAFDSDIDGLKTCTVYEEKWCTSTRSNSSRRCKILTFINT